LRSPRRPPLQRARSPRFSRWPLKPGFGQINITLDSAQGRKIANFNIDKGGKSHHAAIMPAAKMKPKLTVLEDYDVAADAKKRINLRNAKTKYFHVKAFSNGAYLLEPRVLVPLEAVSARSMKMLDKSAANLKKGIASAPINLAAFLKT
jgi:hypothetical protein